MKRTNLSRSGHVPDIVNAVADILNFTYTLHFSRDGAWATMDKVRQTREFGGLVGDSSIIDVNA